MKNLVLTLAMGPYAELGKLTHPTFKSYADRIGADFKCISEQKISQTTPHWEKFQISSLLDEYDRIIYLDTDIIVRDDCPDLFDVVPEDCLGAFDESRFVERSKEMMIDICKQYEVTLPSWDGKYFNTGVLVISQIHRELFIKPEKEIFSFWEQSYLNMMIAKLRIKMHDLDYKFNRMTCMDIFTGEERHESYMIHYAGCPNISALFNLIPLDLEKWKNRGSRVYKRHIHISVNGGLGDQICAEPALRYLIENQYSSDDIIISTHWPRLFYHLSDKAQICLHGQEPFDFDVPYFRRHTLPGPETMQWSMVSHLLCHSVDYVSIALMKRILPMNDKSIKFEVLQYDFDRLNRISKIDDFSDFIAIHPGKHWESKTFPTKWWQAIIEGFISEGNRVAIIGKEEPGDPPDYKAGARGTVEVSCPKEAIDLRNLLDLGTLGALLSQTNLLISNDSAPIHLAGAFDNWIVLIPSCKHPDHVLPYRNGSIFYKSRAFYKELLLDVVESRPTQVYETSADIKVEDWNRWLLPPKDVVYKTLSTLQKDL